MKYSVLKNAGNAAFISLKAAKRLQSADIIWMDKHVDTEVLRHASVTARIFHDLPTVLSGLDHFRQRSLHIVRLLEERDTNPARERFEQTLFKAKGFEIEVIPGISNINRLSAAADFPLTARGRNESFWIWNGLSAACPGIEVWTQVASTRATMAILNPPAALLFRILTTIAVQRSRNTPVLYYSIDGHQDIYTLAQLTEWQGADRGRCHLLMVAPSPDASQRAESANQQRISMSPIIYAAS